MNRAFTKILALALLVATTFSACKKDDDNNDSLAVTKENLVATYTLSSLKVKATGVAEQDVTNDPNYVPTCSKDDQIILKSDLTVQYKDAGTVCSPAGDDTGVWSVAGSTLTMDQENFTVKSFTKGTLVLEETYTQSGITWTFTTTLNRK
jgi:hypothetical protein